MTLHRPVLYNQRATPTAVSDTAVVWFNSVSPEPTTVLFDATRQPRQLYYKIHWHSC